MRAAACRTRCPEEESLVPHPIRIIAWGNIGRRDDGSALILADRLSARYRNEPDVIVQQCHQLGPELVDDLQNCRLALFVDAHARPGGADVTVEKITAATAGDLDSHQCPPDVLLGLTAALGLKVPEAWLIAIRGHEWHFAEGLSEPTRHAMLKAEQRLLALVENARTPDRHPS